MGVKRVSKPLSETLVINILILSGVYQAYVPEKNLFQIQSGSYHSSLLKRFADKGLQD